MDPTPRLRRFVATYPFLAAEVTLLAVVVAGPVALVALAWVAAPVSLLWVPVTATLVAAALLPVALVAHGAADVWRLVAADGWPPAGSVLAGLWRTGEVAVVATFLFFAGGAGLLATEVGSPELSGPEAEATLGVWIGFSALFAAVAWAALVAAVAVRVVWTTAIRDDGGDDGDGDNGDGDGDDSEE